MAFLSSYFAGHVFLGAEPVAVQQTVEPLPQTCELLEVLHQGVHVSTSQSVKDSWRWGQAGAEGGGRGVLRLRCSAASSSQRLRRLTLQ